MGGRQAGPFCRGGGGGLGLPLREGTSEPPDDQVLRYTKGDIERLYNDDYAELEELCLKVGVDISGLDDLVQVLHRMGREAL